MALTKEQVLTTLNLPEFGRRQALGLIKYAGKAKASINTDKEPGISPVSRAGR